MYQVVGRMCIICRHSQMSLSCCKDDLFDVGCAQHVAQMSMRKEAYHKSKASPLELVSYRFFMIPKKVHNMVNRLKFGSTMSEVYWSLMMQNALRDLGKVARVQPYLLGEQVKSNQMQSSN